MNGSDFETSLEVVTGPPEQASNTWNVGVLR